MTWVTPGTSMPRATMSVATSTRTWPLRKALSARWRAFCALLPWMTSAATPSLTRFCATRSAPRLVRAKTMVRPTPGPVTSATRRPRLAAVSVGSTRCSTRSTVVACGATSTRTGSLRNWAASVATSARHGRGEERRLAARVQGGDDLPHRLDEAHVEHAVGLVEHDEAGLVEHGSRGRPSGRSAGPASRRRRRRRGPSPGPGRCATCRRGSAASRAGRRRRRRGSSPRSARRARGSARAPARGRSSAPGRLPSSRSWCRIGSAKAAVLPVPVWAMPRMSRPASCGAIACAWIGVGTS